ncbi:MAG: hypothetical protein LBK65_03820 [Tannerellaceae bacterium]|jgi:hypothetical protein|nr:hypothetical protein [Tannerellaceae bacterium]
MPEGGGSTNYHMQLTMNTDRLNHYVEKYYPAWHSRARGLCRRYSFPADPYDVCMDSILILYDKDEECLDDLLSHEEIGEPRMRNYVGKIITYRVYQILAKPRTLNTESIISY